MRKWSFSLDSFNMLIESLCQEVKSVAELHHVFQNPIIDNSNEHKCVLQLIWRPICMDTKRLGSFFGRNEWKQMCEQVMRGYGMTCMWMVDINPDYLGDSVIAYQ